MDEKNKNFLKEEEEEEEEEWQGDDPDSLDK